VVSLSARGSRQPKAGTVVTVTNNEPAPPGRIEVEYFTDPLCCWSWALEPQWRKLRLEFGKQLTWRYRMGGLIPDWDSYDDPLHSIHRPAQMGPLWFQARELSGMPLEHRIWLEDPPGSSYPACAAFKAAELQSLEGAERFLRRLREAVMLRRQNIARSATLLAIAEAFEEETAGDFDARRFAVDFEGATSLEAFREDLRLARYLGIGRYPTLILRRAGEDRGLSLTGYRPYASLLAALRHLVPEIEPSGSAKTREEYLAYWGNALDRELEEFLRQTVPDPTPV